MRTYGSAPLGHYPATTRAYNNVNSGNRPMGVMPIDDRDIRPMGVMPIDDRDIRPAPYPIPGAYPRNKNIRPMESKADRLFASIIMLFLMMQNVKMR